MPRCPPQKHIKNLMLFTLRLAPASSSCSLSSDALGKGVATVTLSDLEPSLEAKNSKTLGRYSSSLLNRATHRFGHGNSVKPASFASFRAFRKPKPSRAITFSVLCSTASMVLSVQSWSECCKPVTGTLMYFCGNWAAKYLCQGCLANGNATTDENGFLPFKQRMNFLIIVVQGDPLLALPPKVGILGIGHSGLHVPSSSERGGKTWDAVASPSMKPGKCNAIAIKMFVPTCLHSEQNWPHKQSLHHLHRHPLLFGTECHAFSANKK